MVKKRRILLAVLIVGLFVGPLYSKQITCEADLTASVGQLQQPNARLPAFMDLIELAGDPDRDDSSKDSGRQLMCAKALRAIEVCPNLDDLIAAVIERLNAPDRRLETISALLKFSGYWQTPPSGCINVCRVGDTSKLDTLGDRAKEAVNRAADVQTVAEALTKTDATLRKWAVEKFGNPRSSATDWLPLLPKIEKIATNRNDELRPTALTHLARFPGTERFLDNCFINEKGAFQLCYMLHDRNIWSEEFDLRFLPRLNQLLSDPDENVRVEALDFIRCNPGQGIYKVAYGKNIFNQVVRATRSQSAKERFIAVSALACIRDIDRDASRLACLRLVNDADDDVRSGLGFCFAGRFDKDEIKRALAALLKDKCPNVRYMTILAAGPEKYWSELQDLTNSPDRRVAESASKKCREIFDHYKANSDKANDNDLF
jgi:hypothetical protein